MPEPLSPRMIRALVRLHRGHFMLWRVPDVPGGQPTVDALIRRGLLERLADGHVALTNAGVEKAQEWSFR